MLDSHIHIEHQPYSLELIDNMVKVALSRNVDEINLSFFMNLLKKTLYLIFGIRIIKL